MSPKTLFYLSLLVVAIVLLAAGGWLVRGLRRLVAGQPQPRFA